MKPTLLLTTLALTVLVPPFASVQAQTTTDQTQTTQQTQTNTTTTLQRINSSELNRAKNLARQAAEKANGGLSKYRAEDAMHGPADKTPYVDNGNGTWTFTFQGGKPGSKIYTVETVVTVAKEGWKIKVDYNGPIRPKK